MQNATAGTGDILTRHARRRMRQRAIPPIMVDHVSTFGERRYSRGADSYFFTRKSWQRFERAVGPAAKQFQRWRNIYVVVADGHVITAAWRH